MVELAVLKSKVQQFALYVGVPSFLMHPDNRNAFAIHLRTNVLRIKEIFRMEAIL